MSKKVDAPAANDIPGLQGFEEASGLVVVGVHWKKNGVTSENPLNLSGKRDLLITDIDYFIANHDYILSLCHAASRQPFRGGENHE